MLTISGFNQITIGNIQCEGLAELLEELKGVTWDVVGLSRREELVEHSQFYRKDISCATKVSLTERNTDS